MGGTQRDHGCGRAGLLVPTYIHKQNLLVWMPVEGMHKCAMVGCWRVLVCGGAGPGQPCGCPQQPTPDVLGAGFVICCASWGEGAGVGVVRGHAVRQAPQHQVVYGCDAKGSEYATVIPSRTHRIPSELRS